MRSRIPLGCSLLLCTVLVSTLALAQQADQAAVVTPAGSKYIQIPGLPTCSKGAVQNGDPMSGAATILLKTKSGCVIPWHWHTAREQLMIVSGSGIIQMKDEKPQPLLAGTYVNLPSKHQHEFRCTTSCTLFVAIDGAFDIHYVDKSGNEIPAEQALKSSSAASQKTKKPGPETDNKQ